MKTYAKFNAGGMLRCCIEAIPVDPDNRLALAGTENEYRPCPHGCKKEDLGGVYFKNGIWVSGTAAKNKKSLPSN